MLSRLALATSSTTHIRDREAHFEQGRIRGHAICHIFRVLASYSRLIAASVIFKYGRPQSIGAQNHPGHFGMWYNTHPMLGFVVFQLLTVAIESVRIRHAIESQKGT